MKYLILAAVFFVPLLANKNPPILKPTVVFPEKTQPTRTWRSISDGNSLEENLTPENTEVAVKSKAEQEAESFFSSITSGLSAFGTQIPSWDELSESFFSSISSGLSTFGAQIP